MSFVNKLFKKSKKNQDVSKNDESSDVGVISKGGSSILDSKSPPSCEDTPLLNNAKNRRKFSKSFKHSDEDSLQSLNGSATSVLSDVDSDLDEKCSTSEQRRVLKRRLYKLRKEEKKLKRYQNESMALDQEIDQVTTLISVVKFQNNALADDILNKKCELNFLLSEVPDDFETEAKTREPVFYKKYSNVNSAEDAKNLLINVRQKMKSFKYMELLVYDKYLDFHLNLKSNVVQTKTKLLSKNKKRHFGHLTDTIEHKRKSRADKRHRPKKSSFDTGDDQIDSVTTVTIESTNPDTESSPTLLSSTPPLTAPPIPSSLYTPLPMATVCHDHTETVM